MKNILKFISVLIGAAVILTGCEDRSDLTAPTVSTGTANFSKFVSIGNSLTAAYQSGSLYESSQVYAFGNLIAGQVGTNYAIPLVADPGTPGRLEIVSVSPFQTKTNTNSGSPTNTNFPAPYNNLGIPGATLYDVLNATSSTNCFSAVFANSPNPMFDLVLRGLGSQYQQAKALGATFLTLWIGNNDALAYATTGGTVGFTPVANFTALYTQMAASIDSLGAKVAVANIPDVSSIPFLTTVGGQLMQATPPVTAIFGEKGDGQVALLPLQSNFLTLRASEELFDASGNPTGRGFSPNLPVRNKYILDSDEIAQIKSVVTQYNSVIAGIAAAKGWALVDINKLLTDIAVLTAQGKAMQFDGINFSSIYVLGNLFSLDGVHPTNQGQAIIANEFIAAINSKFGAAIPRINVASIPGSLIFAKKITYNKFGVPIFEKGALDNLLF